MKRRRLLATGLALALLAGSAGCSDDDEPPPSADRRTTTTRAGSSSSTTSASTTTTTVSEDGYVQARPDPDLPRQDIDINLRYPATFTPEQVEVVQAWANYRHVFFATLDPPDPDSEFLGRVANARTVGIAKTQRQDLLTSGRVVRLSESDPLAERIQAVSVDGDRAELVTCQVDTALQLDAGTGAVVDDDVTTKLLVARFEMIESGRWLVAPGEERDRWSGHEEKSCDAAS